MEKYTIDKSVLEIDDLESPDKSGWQYWDAKSPSERLEAVEFQRQQLFAYDPTTARLQRVLSVTQRA